MRCRRIVKGNDNYKHIVWFGSYGTIRKLDISYDFNDVTYTSNTQPNRDNFVERFGNAEYLTTLTSSSVYYGDSSQTDVTGLKFGSSSAKGELVLTFTEELSKVTIYATAYKETIGCFIINNDAEQLCVVRHSQSEEPEAFTVTVSGKTLTIQTSKDGDANDNRAILKRLDIEFKINKAIFYNENDKHDNYSEEQQAVADSLTQRLSVIRGELWYAINEGLPLADKITSKGILDSKIASIISKHPDVRSIKNFTSSLDKHTYSCSFVVTTLYGEISVEV